MDHHVDYADDGTTGATNGQAYQAGYEEKNNLSDCEKATAVKATSSGTERPPGQLDW